ncbi:MAG: VWA domain-containing protein [Verrucomicrobiota bacterium]
MNLLSRIFPLFAAVALVSTGLARTEVARESLLIDAELDRPVVPADRDETVVVQIKIRPERVLSDSQRPPVNLSLVLDRSGSMSGRKIEQAIAAAKVAISKLGPRDMLSVIIYDNQIDTLAGAQAATEENISRIRRALERVDARGGTAIYAGLNQAAAELRRHGQEGYINRMILLSDGLANEGPSHVSDFRSLARAFAGEDIVVSSVGLGLDFNEDLMTALAEAGQGTMYFVENAQDLPRIFSLELGDVLNVAATDIEIIVYPKKGAKIIRSIGRGASIESDQARFTLPQVYGGLDKLALLEIQAPAGAAGDAQDLVEVVVNYKPVGSDELRKQQVSVPIAYTDHVEEVKSAANVEVAQIVVENRIAEAKDGAIRYSDLGDTQQASEELKKVSLEVQQRYGFLNDAVVDESSAYLTNEAETVGNAGMSTKMRKVYRSDSYNKFNQNSAAQQE